MIPDARGRTLQVVVSVYQCLSTLPEQEKRRAVLVRSGVIGQPPGLSSPIDKAPLGHPGRRPRTIPRRRRPTFTPGRRRYARDGLFPK